MLHTIAANQARSSCDKYFHIDVKKLKAKNSWINGNQKIKAIPKDSFYNYVPYNN